MLYSESYVQDLIDSGEFQEEDEKGIDVPFYDWKAYELLLITSQMKTSLDKEGKSLFTR